MIFVSSCGVFIVSRIFISFFVVSLSFGSALFSFGALMVVLRLRFFIFSSFFISVLFGSSFR